MKERPWLPVLTVILAAAFSACGSEPPTLPSARTPEPPPPLLTHSGAGPAEAVLFATAAGIFSWSSDDHTVTQVSAFPAYEIEVSPTGELFVGNGGADSPGSGIPTTGIFRIDGAGNAVPVSGLAADDLEFDPAGNLYASNNAGIYRIDPGGPVQVSANPTSQFAFESPPTTVVTTNGGAFAGLFGFRTDRIDLTTDGTALLAGDGGEDIEVRSDGRIFLSGLGGVFEVVGGGLVGLVGGATFDFEFAPSGNIYIGNTANYGGFGFPQGLYFIPPGGPRQRVKDDTGQDIVADINSIEVVVLPDTPEEMLEALLARVEAFLADGSITNAGIAHSLRQKLEGVRAALERGNSKAARNKLRAFVHQVEAQSGKKISPEAAEELIDLATRLLQEM